MPASTYTFEMQMRDAKSIKRFLESTSQYKSSYYMQLKGEAYWAGSKLATHFSRERPTTAEDLQMLAYMATAIRIDMGKRKRHFEAIANRPENVAARNAAYERLGLRSATLDGSEGR